MKRIKIQYYALLREERGLSEETIVTPAGTARELYQELKKKYQFKLAEDVLRVAINNHFAHWSDPLNSDDEVIFIPPVAGG